MSAKEMTTDPAEIANVIRLATEYRVLEVLVNDLLDQDCCLSVNDGEETTVSKSTDADAILKALRTTDEDRIIVWSANGKTKLGSIFLVYGNEPHEVINDYSIALEPLLEVVNDHTSKLADGIDPEPDRFRR